MYFTLTCFLYSFLAQLASTVTPDCHDNEDDLRTLRWHFPNFHWLLRDVLQTPVDDNGEEVCLTTYIKEQVFSKSSSQVQSNVAQALLALFPSFECKKLPTPSLMPDILQNITENEASLSPMFNDAVSQVTREMLNSIKPKKVFGSETSFLTGPIIASLAVKYFDALNTPDSLPDILSNWQLLLEHRLTTVIETLVEEYKSEMEEALKEKLPMEADFQGEGGSHNSEEKYLSLFDIHQDILDQKFRMLQSELSRHIALSMNDQKEDVIEIFKKQIVQYKQNVNGSGGSVSTSKCSSDVVGGEFFRFVQENEEKSRKQCNQVFDDLSRPLIENLSKNLDTFQERYYSLAIGPAKDEVYASKREQFDKVANQLPPGPPGDLKPIGRGNDRVKLTWLKPTHHRRAVKNYEIQMRRKRNWITITEIRKHSLIVVSLKPSTTYHFRVRGNNTNEVGQWSEEAKIKTRLSTGARYGVTAASFVGGTLCAPVVLTALTFKEAYEVVKSSKRLDEKVLAGTGMVIGGTMLPVMVACSTLMAPAAGAVAAEGVYELTGARCEDNLDDTECEYVDIVQLLNQSNTNPQIREEILHEVNSDGTEEELTTTDCQPEQEARFTLSHSTPDTPSPSSKFLESTSSNEEGYEAENESDDIERRTSLTSSISVKNYDETFSASFNLSSFADSENPPEVFTWQIDHHDDTTC